jgi:hypothetical protein
MALHNITASGNQLVIELIVTEGDYAPSLITLKNPSIKLTTDRIKFLDSGVYQTALRFTDINEIGGVAPTDLEEAADLISALIANFSGGGSAPTYKVYTALLTQEGTDAPVATVLENTLGDIVWTRSMEGVYLGTLIGAFTTDKTFIPPYSADFFGQSIFLPISVNGNPQLGWINMYVNGEDFIRIDTYDMTSREEWSIIIGTSKIPIEIRVYN